jgi:hypothetical protein
MSHHQVIVAQYSPGTVPTTNALEYTATTNFTLHQQWGWSISMIWLLDEQDFRHNCSTKDRKKRKACKDCVTVYGLSRNWNERKSARSHYSQTELSVHLVIFIFISLFLVLFGWYVGVGMSHMLLRSGNIIIIIGWWYLKWWNQ